MICQMLTFQATPLICCQLNMLCMTSVLYLLQLPNLTLVRAYFMHVSFCFYVLLMQSSFANVFRPTFFKFPRQCCYSLNIKVAMLILLKYPLQVNTQCRVGMVKNCILSNDNWVGNSHVNCQHAGFTLVANSSFSKSIRPLYFVHIFLLFLFKALSAMSVN